MASVGDEQSTQVGNDRYLLNDSKYGLDLLQQLNDLRNEGVFTDTILCVGQEEFPCHKNILAASSPYFQAMFTNDLRENRDIRVPFDDSSPWTFKRIIDYVYTGRLEITPDNAQEMLVAGCQYHYPAIVQACCNFLERQLHPSNCLGIRYFAKMHSCQSLEESATKYALENFPSLVEYDEFLDISLERMMAFVSSDLIDVRSEETVYESVIRWIKFDCEERVKHLYMLLQEVRLPIIDIRYLRMIQEEPLIQNSDECLALVQEAQVKHETIHDQYGRRRRSMQDTQFHPRPSTVAKEVMVVVGGVNGYLTRSVAMFDSLKNVWLPLPDFPKSVTCFSVASVVNCIIVAGGILDGRFINNAWKFDTGQRIWHEIKPMKQPRAKHASAVLNDRLYIFGGVTYSPNFEVIDLGSIDCYDPSMQEWSIVGNTHFPRILSEIVPFRNTLVEVGGLQSGFKVSTMECYETGVTAGREIMPLREHFILPEAIQFAQIVVLNDVFYIIWEDTKKVITLDPDKRTFQRLPDLQFAHKNCGATVLRGKIYVTGGIIETVNGGVLDSKPSKVVECYDPETKAWTLEKEMMVARGFHGCVTLQM